jgi:hypothetical protein
MRPMKPRYASRRADSVTVRSKIGGRGCRDSRLDTVQLDEMRLIKGMASDLLTACMWSLPIMQSVPGDRSVSHLELCDIGGWCAGKNSSQYALVSGSALLLQLIPCRTRVVHWCIAGVVELQILFRSCNKNI